MATHPHLAPRSTRHIVTSNAMQAMGQPKSDAIQVPLVNQHAIGKWTHTLRWLNGLHWSMASLHSLLVMRAHGGTRRLKNKRATGIILIHTQQAIPLLTGRAQGDPWEPTRARPLCHGQTLCNPPRGALYPRASRCPPRSDDDREESRRCTTAHFQLAPHPEPKA